MKPSSRTAIGAVLLMVLALGAWIGQRHDDPASDAPSAVPTSPEGSSLRPLVHENDARRVRRSLASLPGVGDARVSFGHDDAMSTAVEYGVEMRELASDAAVLRVVRAAFRAFSTDFGETSASLEVNRLNDRVTLESRKPTASAAQVMRVARYAFRASAHDDLVDVTIRARDDWPDPLLATVRINLRGGHARTPADVLRRLDAVDRASIPSHTGLGVTDDSGDGLTAQIGLPTRRSRELWAALNDDPFPARVGFDLWSGVRQDGQHVSSIGAEITPTRLPDGADPEDLAALLQHSIDVMRRTGTSFSFSGTVGLDVEHSIWFDSTTCSLTGPAWLDDVKLGFFDVRQCAP